jgi:hypothetical protein
MDPSSLDSREIEILILALRYWRAQRGDLMRRTDPMVAPGAIDVLLAKLLSQAPPPPADPLADLYHP